MDSLLDKYDIHLESLEVNFAKFVAFLKRYQVHLKLSDDAFTLRFHSMYSKIHDDSISALSKEISSGIDVREDESPIDRVRRMQKDKAKAAAESFYKQLEFFELDPRLKKLFISCVAYCLLCRFKSIADPMDHQIRNGLMPKT